MTAAAGSAATTGAGAGSASLESKGLAAADDFHDDGLTAGFEIGGAAASVADTGTAAAGGTEAALTGADGCTTARSTEATGGFRPTADNDDGVGAASAAAVVGDVLAASALHASRTGAQRTFSAAIVSRSSFSV